MAPSCAVQREELIAAAAAAVTAATKQGSNTLQRPASGPHIATPRQLSIVASPARRSSLRVKSPASSPREIRKVRSSPVACQEKTHPTPRGEPRAEPLNGAAAASTPIKAKKGQQGAFPVYIHVYDLGPVSRYLVNSWALNTRDEDCLGVFHCGVEVLGVEFSFQAMADCGEEDDITGLTWHNPKSHPRHVYRESVNVGQCTLTIGEVSKLLERLEKAWLARHYHCLSNNCVDFAEHFCACLRAPQPFPRWVHGLAKNLARKDSTLSRRLSAALPCIGSCGSSSSGSKSVGTMGSLGSKSQDTAAEALEAAEPEVEEAGLMEVSANPVADAPAPRTTGCSLFGLM
eukprot:gb/GFBE01054956.1/.p1 GENE.gb/GFBE01054956.1/~~gb/GFBE01054956.1/.p1  ORF type:complete len:345 (+),score=73.42 gb/GFBE01054956.1/:1-1035(+)